MSCDASYTTLNRERVVVKKNVACAGHGDAINAGWNQPNDLKEPDFDALRGWDDFKKLLAEPETRDKAKAAKKEAASK